MSSPKSTILNELARERRLALWVVALAFVLPFRGIAPEQETSVVDQLIVVQVPAGAPPQPQVGESSPTLLDRYVDGTRIVRIDPNGGGKVVLTPEFTGAYDPEVSFDGQTLVFAGKREPGDSWQIWTMNVDGSNKTQITRGPGQSVAPVFAGARFYLDDPQPTPQIVFAGNEHDSVSFALYSTDRKGASVRRLTFNLHSDFSPAVLPTGQVVFTSRQRRGDPLEPDGIFALLAVNIDGTDLMPFYGNHEEPWYRDMAAVSPVGDRVYFVESESASWFGGGELAYVSWRQPLSSYGNLREGADGRGEFHSPRPLPDGGLLASYRPNVPGSEFAVYRLDPESGRRLEKVFEEPGWHSVDTQVLSPRAPVRGRSNWLRPGSTTGVFYCLDCYRTNLGEGGRRSVAPAGTIKHLRVIEGLPRRILGVAPVEEDGSFHIRVPAETPITFQLLDEDYRALRTQRAWTWVMGNENRGCIGCHEDRELSPPNRMVMAIAKPPVDLVLPPARRRSVDFRHQIAPIIESSCATAGCHVPGGVEPTLGEPGTALSEAALRSVYRSLLAHPEGDSTPPYVVPGSARESPLIRLLLGRAAGSPQSSEAGHDVLGRRESILFIEWVDLGAAWESMAEDDGRTH